MPNECCCCNRNGRVCGSLYIVPNRAENAMYATDKAVEKLSVSEDDTKYDDAR